MIRNPYLIAICGGAAVALFLGTVVAPTLIFLSKGW